jgi:DNA-binding response OmpR family regulator
MADSARKVLVVEDDREIAALVKLHLEDAGCHVALAHDGATGLRSALDGAWSLVILDLMLPELEGLDLCRRLRALATRRESGGRIEIAGLAIDLDGRRVSVDGRPADLTAKEFELLVQFARHPGRVYTRAQLLDQVWGYARQSYPHTVNSHINRLRAKIERDPSQPRYVLTVWGVGYRFLDPRDAAGR